MAGTMRDSIMFHVLSTSFLLLSFHLISFRFAPFHFILFRSLPYLDAWKGFFLLLTFLRSCVEDTYPPEFDRLRTILAHLPLV